MVKYFGVVVTSKCFWDQNVKIQGLFFHYANGRASVYTVPGDLWLNRYKPKYQKNLPKDAKKHWSVKLGRCSKVKMSEIPTITLVFGKQADLSSRMSSPTKVVLASSQLGVQEPNLLYVGGPTGSSWLHHHCSHSQVP